MVARSAEPEKRSSAPGARLSTERPRRTEAAPGEVISQCATLPPATWLQCTLPARVAAGLGTLRETPTCRRLVSLAPLDFFAAAMLVSGDPARLSRYFGAWSGWSTKAS